MSRIDKLHKYYALRDDVKETINYLSSASDSLMAATDSLNTNFKVDDYSKAALKIKEQQKRIASTSDFLKNTVIPAINKKIRDLQNDW